VGDVRTEAAAYHGWAWGIEWLGDYNVSWPKFEQALTLARAANFRQEEASILGSMGAHLLQQGDIPGGRTYAEQELRIRREVGDRRGEGQARLTLGHVAMAEGDYEGARAYYHQAAARFLEVGDRESDAWSLFLRGCVCHYLGDYHMARAYYDQCLKGSAEVGNRRHVAYALCHLGLLCHHTGDNEATQEHARQALQMAREQRYSSLEGASALCLGHALVSLGSLHEARDAYRQSVALLSGLGLAHRAMEPVAGLARVCLAEGELAQAREHVEEILTYLKHRTLGNVWVLGEPLRVYLTCYRVLKANGDTRADDILEQGYRFLQERAAKISDEGERRSYLENVAANRELLQEYEHYCQRIPNE